MRIFADNGKEVGKNGLLIKMLKMRASSGIILGISPQVWYARTVVFS